MSVLCYEQSHDQNIKTLIVENPWAAITFAMPKCVNFFRHEPEIEPIREETLKTLFYGQTQFSFHLRSGLSEGHAGEEVSQQQQHHRAADAAVHALFAAGLDGSVG